MSLSNILLQKQQSKICKMGSITPAEIKEIEELDRIEWQEDIVEDITEELNIAGEFMAFQMKDRTAEYVQFMALFTNEDSDISIEEVVKDYIG